MLAKLLNNALVKFILLFIGVYFVLYYSVQFITGLAVPGGMYSPFVQKYFDMASFMRTFLILSAKYLLHFFNFSTTRIDEYTLRSINGNGIRIVYACLGFAVLCFWAALIIATADKFWHKVKWFFVGFTAICFINIVRISLVLIAVNKGWQYPFNLNHHVWFNIFAYSIIFILMYIYNRNISIKK